jgi:hypothetical protein
MTARIWNQGAIAFVGLFLISVAAMAADPAVMEVYNPTGAVEITELHAPRLDSLAGKTICELSNDTWQAHRVLPEIRRLLQERYPTARFIPFTEFPKGNEGIDNEKTAELAAGRGCQAAIIGNAG